MRMCAVQWSILCFLESPSPPQFCNHNWVQQHILPRKPQQAGGTGSGAQGGQWDAWTYPAFSWWLESHLQRKDKKQVRGVNISTLSASANFLDNCYKERIMNSMHFMAINVWHKPNPNPNPNPFRAHSPSFFKYTAHSGNYFNRLKCGYIILYFFCII